MQPSISAGEDEAEVQHQIETLLSNGWTLRKPTELVKKFHFKTYTKVLDLHHMIGIASKAKNHHPVMTSEFGTLTVCWTTHHPGGLSQKDTVMARVCDDHARLIGTVGRDAAATCAPTASAAVG